MVQALTQSAQRRWRIRILAGAGACAFVSAGGVRADDSDVIPSAYPISRYEKSLTHSPFALPTSSAPAAAPTQKQPGWSDDLYIAGVMTVGAQNVVTISQRGDAQRFLLASGEESLQGTSVINVQWSEQLGQTRVTVKKGTEFAVLLFDQSSLASARSAVPAARPPSPTPPPNNFIPPGAKAPQPQQPRPPQVGPTFPNPGGQPIPIAPATAPGVATAQPGADFPRPRPTRLFAPSQTPPPPPPRDGPSTETRRCLIRSEIFAPPCPPVRIRINGRST